MPVLGLRVSRVQPFQPKDAQRLVSTLPHAPGVYIVRHRTFGIGDESVVYVGCAAGRGGLRQRIAQYFSPGPTQWTNQRVLARITELDGHEIFVRTLPHPLAARMFEWRLLKAYLARFGRLPAYNLRLPARPEVPSKDLATGPAIRTRTMTVVLTKPRTTFPGGAVALPAETADGTSVLFWGSATDQWNIGKIESIALPVTVRCLARFPNAGETGHLWVPQHSPVEVVSVANDGTSADSSEWLSLSDLVDRQPSEEVSELWRLEVDNDIDTLPDIDAYALSAAEDDVTSEVEDYDADGDERKRGDD